MLFATEGAKSQVLLSVSAFNKKTQKTPPGEIATAERRLADWRGDAGLTQSELAKRMGTSQGQVTRFESGADTRLSTVARYAAAIGMKVEWSLTPIARPRPPKVRTPERAAQRA